MLTNILVALVMIDQLSYGQKHFMDQLLLNSFYLIFLIGVCIFLVVWTFDCNLVGSLNSDLPNYQVFTVVDRGSNSRLSALERIYNTATDRYSQLNVNK